MIRFLFFYYWPICLLKNSPENTPYSQFSLGLSAVLLMLIMVLKWHYYGLFDSGLVCLGAAFSVICSFALYTYLILRLKNVSNRFNKSLTTIFFTYFIIHFIALPLMLLDLVMPFVQNHQGSYLLIALFYLLITLGLSVWKLVVTAFIYKNALNASPIQAVLAAFGLVAANILTVSFWR